MDRYALHTLFALSLVLSGRVTPARETLGTTCDRHDEKPDERGRGGIDCCVLALTVWAPSAFDASKRECSSPSSAQASEVIVPSGERLIAVAPN